MLVKEKFYSFFFIKKYFFLIRLIIIYLFLTNVTYAEIKDRLIEKIKNTDTLTFQFKQQISNKIETGNCIIKYPKLLKCDYDDKYEKRLISNGKTVAIIQKRYNKIMSIYPLKATILYFVLDKEYLIKFINNNKAMVLDDFLVKYVIKEKNKKIIIFFDKNSLDLMGWETEDLYKNNVKLKFSDIKTNIPVEKKMFKIPTKNEL